MTMPAEITSEGSWDRLIVGLRTQYADIDELYQRITDPDVDADEPDTFEGTEPMPDPDVYPYRGYDPDAVLDDERVRLDAETDGRLDGDDTDAADEPDLDA